MMNPASLTKRTVLGAALLGLLCTGVALARSDKNPVVYKETFETAGVTTGVWADNAKVATTGGWYAASADASFVTNMAVYGLPAEVVSPISPGQGGRASRVLRLNTEGVTLTNLLDGATLTSKDIWVDTLVQMVVSEDYPVAISNDVNVKAAVFMNTSSNLVVYHGTFNAGGDWGQSAFTVTTNKVVPNNWYRLTIALEDTLSPAQNEAFKVTLNGVDVAPPAAGKSYSASWASEFNSISPPGGPWFLSAARRTGGVESSFPTVVQALAFQGTGYIDDLVVTDSDPFYVPSGVMYWFLNVGTPTGAGTGTVSPAGGAVYAIPVGNSTNVSVAATGYFNRIQSLTTNGVAVAGAANAASISFTAPSMAANTTNTLATSFYEYAWTLQVTSYASGTVNPATGSFKVLVGSSTNVVATANDWYRIQSMEIDDAAQSIGSDPATYNLSVPTGTAGQTKVVDVAFYQPSTFTGFGSGAIDSAWLASWSLSEATIDALAPATVDMAYLLDLIPTATLVPTIEVTKITVNGTSASVEVLLKNNGAPLDTQINGILRLKGKNSLSDVSWANVTETGAAISNADFDVNGKATLNLTGVTAAKFYLAVIESAP